MALGIKGLIGRFVFNANGSELELRQTDSGALAIAQVEPPYKEVSRSGRHFIGGLSTVTGRAPVQAIPTTTATVYLYNADPILSYCVDYLGIVTASGTPAAGCSLLGLMSKPTGTAPTAGSNYTIAQSSPSSARGSKAIIAEAYTIPTVDTSGVNSWKAWGVLASANFPAAAFIGGGDASDHFKEGRLVIPPGWGLAMAFLSGAGTSPLYGVHAEWSEIQIDQE